MQSIKEIKRALISVYYKDGLEEIVRELDKNGVEILSTGGTFDFIQNLGIQAKTVESVTGYPSILGGRVKTLHPKVFGGILNRRENATDQNQIAEYDIPSIDLVIVDLYPFEEYVAAGASKEEIIEKIDIGGISLIRGAAKNYNDVVIVPSKESYAPLLNILKENGAKTTLEQREYFATQAFLVSSHYDTAIFSYFNSIQPEPTKSFSKSITGSKELRYGENPHQKGFYYGADNSLPAQLHGKEISYNNLLDIEAAVELISDFEDTTVAIIKHNNACGCASAQTLLGAWDKALEADPVSAFGGIIIANREIDQATAEQMNKIFFEVVIAPAYSAEALEILKSKKNRIILENKDVKPSSVKFRSPLGGVLEQARDSYVETPADLKPATNAQPKEEEIDDLIFANKLVKHSKSNAIVLAKGKQMLASGIGQTSRVDALKQAIAKAKSFNFDLNGAVMASDAFFPFADCVEIAANEGIKTVIQPGGSIRDNESIEWCNNNGVAMVFTGIRHFKH
ncbi:MAG: bifunctional phosphoribosylaminoimidazolecarboxamide formyltransferase/IMP cyclohydrolase [Bacteroidales bacterium]|nr:bifunctional phosphoribosylaminoimidazolecarboxamide formyltransferase/IMP cyclohydrolase [Bacteroidales bacterium]